MTTTEQVLQSATNRTNPWSYLGSVSSVSPVPIMDSSDTVRSIGQPLYNSTVKSVEDSYNGTGYFIDEEDDSMLSDIKTVIFACLATLVPLVFILIIVFGARLLWIQYKTRKKDEEFDGMFKENTTDSMTKPLHSHLLNDKSSEETHLSINSEAVEICAEISTASNRPNNINGSIITMTLKNNHLIVETEERDDIEEDSRETTMRYSPSARDGVFVVEVQQGVRRSPGSGGASFVEPERSGSTSDECALVHNPPEKYSDEETLEEYDDSEYYIETTSPDRSTPGLSTNSKTGLSTSNTSLGSLHRSYCYTTQECYDHGNFGYNTYHGYINDHITKRLVENTKPKITSAVYKTNPTVKNRKSMSFDLPVTNRDVLKEKVALVQNSSMDMVLESNGLEEFSSNLYRTKLLKDDEITNCDVDVNTDVKSMSLFKAEVITELKQSDAGKSEHPYQK